MTTLRLSLIAAAAAFLLAACAPAPHSRNQAALPVIGPTVAGANLPAKNFFGAAQTAAGSTPAVFGGYAKGCVAGARQLAETGPTWQAMRLSRNRNWGHPEVIDYLQDLSRAAARLPGWEGIYVGDMSQPRGGPMTSGHRSHQSGLDADVWLRPANELTLTRSERENISSTSMRRANGAFTNDRWTPAHEALLKAAASDPRVSRIFIFPGAKVAMCRNAGSDRDWLRKIRPWYGHHYHFHVRLNCPAGDAACVDQTPPPPGDGCAEAQQWVDNILNPPAPDPDAPPPAPRREVLLADLPQQCAALLP